MSYKKELFKKDSKGKIRTIILEAKGDWFYQTSGILGGKMVEHRKQMIEKNIGKKNYTTGEEQAKLLVDRTFKTKLDREYFNSIESAQNTEVILPQLAKDYFKEKKKIDWDCTFIQPKLDGMRAIWYNGQLISRQGKVIENMDHIIDELKSKGITEILDGELYVHGENFQTNMKYIKKYRPGKTERIQFWVYDLIQQDIEFNKRNFNLVELVNASKLENVQLTPTFKIESESEITQFHKNFLEQTFEGSIIRTTDLGYVLNKRTHAVLKYKDFIDETFTVIDVLSSTANPEQGVIRVQLNKEMWFKLNSSGNIEDLNTDKNLELGDDWIWGYPPFKCGMKFSHEDRKEILSNKENYIGQIAEVRFFERSEWGIPRFPVCVGFRLDKQ